MNATHDVEKSVCLVIRDSVIWMLGGYIGLKLQVMFSISLL